MNEKELNSQIGTTIEQSKRLLELGLNPETADMSYYILDDEPVLIIGITQVYREILKGGKIVKKQNAKKIPAWSLHRLLCMLDYDNANTFNIMPNLAYEDLIATISLRICCGAFNKEYLKQ